MMRRLSAFIACSLLIALFLSALAFAQKPSDKPQQKKPQPVQQDDQTTKVGVYEVRLPVAVALVLAVHLLVTIILHLAVGRC